MRKPRIEKLQSKYPLLTKEKLNELYIDQQKSLPVIHKEYHIDFKACSDLLKHYEIPIRSISQSRLTVTAKEKIVNSFKEKYGVENPSQLDWVQKKKEKTFKKHYGVDNIWKSKEYYEWLNDYMILHYGVKRITTNSWGWKGVDQKKKNERIEKLWGGRDKWWLSLTDEEKSAVMARLCNSNTFTSKIETRVGDVLNRIHITYKKWVNIGNRNFDFKIDGCKILIEVNGDFWHANPKKYKADDIINFPNGKIKASVLWERDKKKGLTAEKNGYKMITIWEDELKTITDEDLEHWLLQRIIL